MLRHRVYRLILFGGVFLALASRVHAAQSVRSSDDVADSLAQFLPEKLVTIVDKTLDDQFAQIEELASQLPVVKNDKKKVFLITLPMENYLEDIYFSANRPAVIYPRLIFQTIRQEFQKGKSKKEVARILVKLQQKNAFEKMARRIKRQK